MCHHAKYHWEPAKLCSATLIRGKNETHLGIPGWDKNNLKCLVPNQECPVTHYCHLATADKRCENFFHLKWNNKIKDQK